MSELTDRELDAAVAKARGDTVPRVAIATGDGGASAALVESSPPFYGEFRVTRKDVEEFCQNHPSYEVGEWSRVKRYSTDISVAWELVEEMAQTGGIGVYNSTDGGWCMEHVPSEFNTPSVTEYADTAPRAICLAYLKAKEAK